MRIFALILILILISGCGTSHEKTGEAVLFNSDKLKVKVVQIYEDMPWHYYGLKHETWCQSPKTMDMAWGGMERGWSRLGYSGIGEPGQSPSKATKKKALDAAVLDTSKQLRVLNDEAIVFAGSGIFTLTINGCESFSTWNGWYLPEDMVIQVEKSPYCKEGGCQWENFRGEREIKFTDIQIDVPSKKIFFRAHSKAFKDGNLLVRSEDGGIHWAVTK